METNPRALLDFPGIVPEQLQTIGRRALELFPSAKERLGNMKEQAI
jgi:hypothetical protein